MKRTKRFTVDVWITISVAACAMVWLCTEYDSKDVSAPVARVAK